jgi:hypothetical protein
MEDWLDYLKWKKNNAITSNGNEVFAAFSVVFALILSPKRLAPVVTGLNCSYFKNKCWLTFEVPEPKYNAAARRPNYISNRGLVFIAAKVLGLKHIVHCKSSRAQRVDNCFFDGPNRFFHVVVPGPQHVVCCCSSRAQHVVYSGSSRGQTCCLLL